MSPLGSGAGTALNPVLLTCAGIATLIATLISFGSIYLHLKNYRKNILQRAVVRIMVMIPIYGISSFISLFSLEAAFFIDAVRDIYEAFVIYVFFQLLLGYLGGERSLLILLHGRPPVHPLFPISLVKRDIDASDPHTYLWLKRGILQYVQVKPILAAATIILKALGKFHEGDLKAGSGYLYISIIYNVSICVALYCLAMFWVVVNADLRPFRPMPKFLCVKGILFFSFWQSFFISILVAAGAVRSLGPYTEASYISLALTDLMICLEMPLFAIAHMYAFSHTDYIDQDVQYAARMPLRYAFRDAFGLKDVVEDSKATLRGEGMDYRTFEPAEGKIHQGSGRDRRIRAGLRYARGGQQKYWLPMPTPDNSVAAGAKRSGGPGAVDQAHNRVRGNEEDAHVPLLEDQARDAVHTAPDLRGHHSDLDSDAGSGSDGFSLTYSDPHQSDDELYANSKSYIFGDYNYPCIDVSGEAARRMMWNEEERILRDQRAAYFSPSLGPRANLIGAERRNYGAAGTSGARPHVSGASEVSTGSKRQKGKETERHRHSVFDERTLGEDQVRGAAIIDMDSDRIPDLEVGGVKMKWSKSGRLATRYQQQTLPSPAPPNDYEDPDSASPKSDSSPSIRHRRSLSPPRDAVDLVVEDPDADAERLTRERRKGEPAIHKRAGDSKALRKVYRRMHEVGEEGKETETVINGEESLMGGDGRGSERGQLNEAPIVATKGEDEDVKGGDRLLKDLETGVTDVIVAHAMMPPPHVRVVLDQSLVDGEDNPWRS